MSATGLTLELGDVAGEHFVVTLRSRAHPGGLTPVDHNWLAAEVALRGGPQSRRFSVFLRSRDFARFERDLGALLDGRSTAGRFWPADPWLTIELAAADDDGAAARWDAELGARDPVAQRVHTLAWRFDRPAGERLLQQVGDIVQRYPVVSAEGELMTAHVDFTGEAILGPLTRGGNLPFRRLCVHLGARVTTSEMAYARKLVRGSRPELALLRNHDDETCFGVQIVTSNPAEAVVAGKLAVERGATFVDVNFGCPIHDVVRRGMGATLLRRPAKMALLIEAMARDLPVPVTAKIRSGWSESKTNALAVGKQLEEAGAAAITLHARSREQRYSKIADWNLIGQLVEELSIPVIGNGDLLTHYEAAWRQQESGCAGVMLARGALVKPWLFREIAEGRSWEPTAEERIAVYRQLAVYMKEHFRSDQEGRRRTMYFLPWHLGFFCRYRPLPEAEWRERAREHPLMQTRLDAEGAAQDLPLLEAMLRDPRPEMHELIAGALWDSESDDEAVAALTQLGAEVPPERGLAAESMKTSNG